MIRVPEDDIERPVRSRKTCRHCEATPAGCRGHKFLSGRHCCEACTGDHDQEAP